MTVDANSQAEQRLKQQRKAQAKMRRMVIKTGILFLATMIMGSIILWGVNAQGEVERAEQARSESLFESMLTHASLLAKVEDYTAARRILAKSRSLDDAISDSRHHARNLLTGYVNLMTGGEATMVYRGAGAALIGGARLTPDGSMLIAAGEHGTLVMFDAKTGKLLKKLQGHGDNDVNTIAIDPHGRWFFSAGEDKNVKQWSLPAGEQLYSWRMPSKVFALAISPNGKRLAIGGADGDISLRSIATRKIITVLKGHERAVGKPNGLRFSPDPDGARLASASYDGTVRIWDMKDYHCIHTLSGHTSSVTSVAFSPDGDQLATASYDHTIILWNSHTGKHIRSLKGHHNVVFDVRYSKDGRSLFTVSRDNVLRQWDVNSGIVQRIYQGHEAGIVSVDVQGKQIYTAANDGTVRRWSIPDGKGQGNRMIWELGATPISTAIAPDGSMIAIGFANGTLRLYSATGQQLFDQLDAHESYIIRLSFNHEGSLLATAGMDGKAKIWRIKHTSHGLQLHLCHTIKAHDGVVYDVTFSPDGRQLATVSLDGSLGVFDVATGEGNAFKMHDVLTATFLPPHRIMTAGQDNLLRLWQLNDNGAPTMLWQSAKGKDMLFWAAVSPDGTQVATVGRRQSNISLYQLEPHTAAPEQHLVSHEQTVFRVIYTPDSKQLATVDSDMTLRLWDVEKMQALFTLRLPTEIHAPSPIWDFAFQCLPSGDCIAAIPLTVGRLAVYRFQGAGFRNQKVIQNKRDRGHTLESR